MALTHHFCSSPPSLKRNWAKGQRLEFLQSHLVPYQSALRQSRARGAEYADTVVNKYFESFHWRLPIDEDPPTTSPVNPDSAPMQEDLTEEEQREKGEVISKMRKVIRILFIFYFSFIKRVAVHSLLA